MERKTIFFSYGHDCTVKVLRIKKDLEKLGYRVWMDKEGILPGDEWRTKITEKILSSDIIVAFLSSHSLRKDSVCLNELAIAVSRKSGFIRTVLLEVGLEDRIPATISGIQYCDMGEWDEYEALSSEAFESWYREKFHIFLGALERNGDKNKDAQLVWLGQILSPFMESSRRNVELQKPFINRKWVERRVERWLDISDSSQYLLLYGGPGTGKSAFSAHYFHFDSRTVCSIFCEWGCRNYSDTAQIIKNIAFQMALKLSAYRIRLTELLESSSGKLASYGAQELFDLLLIQPLYGWIENNTTILVIIDGADEANANGRNELAELLASYADRLPSFLKILITSRNDSIVQRCFSDCEELHIDMYQDENRKDIYRFLKEQLRAQLNGCPSWRREQILDELARKSENSFLYAELLVKSIRASHYSLDRISKVPKGLYGLYFTWMQRKFPDTVQYEEEYWPALNLIAASGRLPVRMLEKALGIRDIRLRKFVRQMKTFLETEKNALGEECLYLFHRSFAEWLSSENADVYELSVEAGERLLAETMLASYQSGTMSDFETEHLLEYLKKSGMEAEYWKVSEDREYLCRLYQLGQNYEAISGGLWSAEKIFRQTEELLSQKLSEDSGLSALYVGALCGRGRCLFGLGCYGEALDILLPATDEIFLYATAEERMQSLAVIGAVYDWKGERKKSAEIFKKLLEIARQEGNPHFILQSYEGLIWNEHFNDVSQAEESLADISTQEFSDSEEVIYNLCRARVMLSEGRLEEALECYDRCLAGFDFYACDNLYTMKKTKMLLLEILPACFDNHRYLDGVRCGLHIWSFIKNRGWLEECYCASWLALNYLRLGDTDAAEDYLNHARACNNTISAAAKSSWMQMQLSSVEAFLCFERGQYEEAAAAHRQVILLARQCQDAWMLGDACFELLVIRMLFHMSDGVYGERTQEEIMRQLDETGNTSGLRHLKAKSLLLKALQAADGDRRKALELERQAREASNSYQLASMDPLEMYYIEYRIACLAAPDRIEDAKAQLTEVITEISAKNRPDSRLQRYDRLFAERIKKEVWNS